MGERTIDKEKILIGFVIVAIIVAIVLLILPEKEEKSVTKTPEPTVITSPESNVTIKLYGENPYYVFKGKKYDEPGYEAFDNNQNVSYKIKKSGTVNTSVPGQYEITYEVDGITAKRIVVVSDLEASILAETQEYTKDSFNIMVSIKGSDYSKTVLPNGKTTLEKAIEYEVSDNGTYKFTIYDKYGNKKSLEQKVTNFDKEAPTGSCTNKLDLGKTIVEVKASDTKTSVVKYDYSNGEKTNSSTSPKYEYSGLYKNVSVTLYDKVGNKATIKCVSSGEGVLPQIKAPSGANIIKESNSDSLKISIEKKNNYYIARIWMLDPYTQINKAVIKDWGVRREHPGTIFKREVETKNLSNKIFIGINGSGFYENGSWTVKCDSAYYNKYNRTTEGGLVITDGKVIRNWYQDGAVDRACFGTNELCRTDDSIYVISKEGYIDTYQKFGRLSESERKTLFQQIIDKGYSNTWVFRPVLMLNGKETADSSALTGNANTSKRTLVCQINRNNYVLLVGDISNSQVMPTFKNLGCQTAFSMDGGGSYAMIYKERGGSLQTIVGGGREVVDTLYITEK